jgi:hypothetical protein
MSRTYFSSGGLGMIERTTGLVTGAVLELKPGAAAIILSKERGKDAATTRVGEPHQAHPTASSAELLPRWCGCESAPRAGKSNS